MKGRHKDIQSHVHAEPSDSTLQAQMLLPSPLPPTTSICPFSLALSVLTEVISL